MAEVTTGQVSAEELAELALVRDAMRVEAVGEVKELVAHVEDVDADGVRSRLYVPDGAVGALLSVPVAALVFTGLFAIGGNVPVDLGAVVTAMLGWHTVIGIGEAVITGLVVATVVATRPDLVHGAQPLLAERRLETRKVDVS